MSPDYGPAVSQPVTWKGLFEQIGKVFLTLFLLLCAFAEYAKGFMSYLYEENPRDGLASRQIISIPLELSKRQSQRLIAP